MRQLSESFPDGIATLVLGILVVGVLLDRSEARFVGLVSLLAGGAATWPLIIRDIRGSRSRCGRVWQVVIGHFGGDLLMMDLGPLRLRFFGDARLN